MSKKNLSRRDFLRVSGAAVAGGLSPLANLSRESAPRQTPRLMC